MELALLDRFCKIGGTIFEFVIVCVHMFNVSKRFRHFRAVPPAH
jgi:hypothetical protein